MSEKIVLVDGHSILNRAFYGVPDLTNAEGFHTNAIYGFLNILFKILEEEQAEYLAVAFDVHAPTFRHEMYEAYKGTRKGMPDELREQVPEMKSLLQDMGVLTLEKAGLEADDILGTLAKKAEKDGMEVSLISGDRDLLQIASEHIRIRIPKTRGGKTEVSNYYAKDVLAEYQVTPQQFIELKALMGDASDNIPGVPKVGEKTATKLMVEYGSIGGIYEHLAEITQKSVRESLEQNRELADLSLKLARIEVHAQIDFSYEDAKLGNLYTQSAYKHFQKLGFKNLLGRFEEKGEEEKMEYRVLSDENEVRSYLNAVKDCLALSVYQEEGEVLGFAVSSSEENAFLLGNFKDEIQKLLKKQVKFYLFGAKEFYRLMEIESDMVEDVKMMAYLLNPLQSEYEITDLSGHYLGRTVPGYKEKFGKKSVRTVMEEDKEKFFDFACDTCQALYKITDVMLKEVEKTGQMKVYREIELPLTLVLHHMEEEGVLVQAEELKRYGENLAGKILELEESIHRQADSDFNINSPKQLGEVLFEKLHLPGGKKTKTGYSTAADVLEKLAVDYPLVNDILEYRTLSKLKSTYADGLGGCIAEDGRIHTTFHQTITATGRISSTEPNLQNIPIRMELGRQIRRVFVPREGFVLMDADYSQIELRVLASMSGDQELINAYKEDADIHRITASKVFHVPMDEVTPLQRRNAKAVNFGIVYGISSFGLSQGLSITRKEANDYIERYFETYPGIKNFLDNCVKDAKEKGYSVTLFGRKRPIPELKSSNFMQRSFGERVAMNAPIQGTAADIIKIAMLHVDERLRREGLSSRLILQVHDELLIEVADEEVEKVKAILTEEMKGAADLAVSLEIDLNTGDNWYDAH